MQMRHRTTIKPLANKYELQQAADTEDVIILFLHTSETSKADLVRLLAASLA